LTKTFDTAELLLIQTVNRRQTADRKSLTWKYKNWYCFCTV